MRWLNLILVAVVGFAAGWLVFGTGAAPDARTSERDDESHLVLRMEQLEADHQRLLIESEKLRRRVPKPKPDRVKTPSTRPTATSVRRESGEREVTVYAVSLAERDRVRKREDLLAKGHKHRNARRFKKAAQAYESVRLEFGPSDEAWVEATFQLAWNASFAGDRDEAVRLFQDAANAPGATEKYKAMSAYNIATIRESKEDIALARVEFEAVVRDFGESTDGMVRHYVKLAKDAVERLK